MPEVITILSRLALASIFLIAAGTKLPQLSTFGRDLEQYLIPAPAARLTAVLLPILEMAIALALYSGFLARLASVAAIVLLSAFILLVVSVIIRRLNVSCSCFGILYRERVGTRTIVRDGVLLAFAIIVFIDEKALSLGTAAETFQDLGSIILVVLTGLSFVGSTVIVVYANYFGNARHRAHDLPLEPLSEAT